MHRMVMLIVLSGVLIWSCAVPGAFEENETDRPDQADVATMEQPKDHTCDAGKHRTLIGRLIEEIDVAALPRPLRVYPAGSRITMDHRPERLNVVVGTDGSVVKVRCG